MKADQEADQPTHPRALEYNGVDQYVDFGDVLDPELNDFLMFGWVKFPVLTSMRIMAKYEDDNNRLLFSFDATDKIAIYARDAATIAWNYISTAALTQTDQWIFVAAVVDRASQFAKAYVDGVEIALTETTQVDTTTVIDNAGTFKIGRENSAYSDGQIGLAGMYIFPGGLPTNYENAIITKIYNETKGYYLDE
jgi:hypothetical protein